MEDNKRWQGCGEKRTLVHCWWDQKLVQSVPLKASFGVPQKDKQLPYDPEISLIGILVYPKELKIGTQVLVHKCSQWHCSQY